MRHLGEAVRVIYRITFHSFFVTISPKIRRIWFRNHRICLI